MLYNEPLDFNFEAEPREIAVRADDFLLREELPLSQVRKSGFSYWMSVNSHEDVDVHSGFDSRESS